MAFVINHNYALYGTSFPLLRTVYCCSLFTFIYTQISVLELSVRF